MTRGKDNLLMRNATSVAIFSVTLLFLVAATLIYQQGQAGNASKALVLHTYEVTGHIQLLFNRLKDVELGQRGYIIAGEEEYLAPYRDALKDSLGDDARSDRLEQHHSLTEELNIVRRLTSDNPVQQQNLDEMANYLKELLQYWSASIEARLHQDADGTAPADFRQNNRLMDHVRRLVSIMMAEENRLLETRTEADEAGARQSNRLIFSGLAVFYGIMVLSVWFYQRGSQRYTRQLEQNQEELKMQQEELQATNEEMEEKNSALEEQNTRIQQQTEELTESSRLIQEKANELERASRYKSEFLANMSHELRTPLNSLLILAKLLASNEEGNLTDEQVQEAQIIYNGGLELLELINDILDLSKIEAGKLILNNQDIPLADIVKTLQQQFAPVARQSGIEFPVIVADNLPPVLHTDAQRVEQVLKNLLANAFKFTAKGSVTLSISSPDEKQQGGVKQANMIAFAVIDTGIGIDATKFKDIFEAFQQENGSIDRHYGGTGLGLTIARKFAHMLGGEIHVQSRKGEGSTFTLLLPVQAALPQAHAPEPLEQPAQQASWTPVRDMPSAAPAEFIPDDRKIIGEKDKVLLIIEDDRNFALVLQGIARKRGYKCLCAGDGKSGLLLAMERRVTAIILDLKLPDIDGLQVLDQLKHNLRTRPVPVHVITACDAGESFAPLRKGAIGYLTKPAGAGEIEGVFQKIEALLQSKMKELLVIEDDEKTQVALGNLLKKKDTRITTASTGRAALDHIGNQRFDCIILDLHLPDMSGFEWLGALKTQAADAAVPPIIIYTGRELSEEENRRLSSVASSIIIKGAKSPERLLDEVTLFLHSVESTLSADQQEIIRMQHDPGKLLQGRTVLLVDDDMRNTFALSKLLKQHGMKVIIAENGRAALDALAADNTIELVIMDIMMPVMDGYQAMREIRASKEYGAVPVIALTARAMPEEQKKCMEAGANDYMTKPVDVERLLTLLRVWLFRQDAA